MDQCHNPGFHDITLTSSSIRSVLSDAAVRHTQVENQARRAWAISGSCNTNNAITTSCVTCTPWDSFVVASVYKSLYAPPGDSIPFPITIQFRNIGSLERILLDWRSQARGMHAYPGNSTITGYHYSIRSNNQRTPGSLHIYTQSKSGYKGGTPLAIIFASSPSFSFCNHRMRAFFISHSGSLECDSTLGNGRELLSLIFYIHRNISKLLGFFKSSSPSYGYSRCGLCNSYI